MKARAPTLVALLAMLSGEAVAAPQAGDYTAFITCPIFRDTDLGCHVARNEGVLYSISAPPPFNPEQGHKVLVEGVVGSAPDVCGGKALDHLNISVLPEIDETCRERLPAEGFATPMPPPEVLFELISHLGDEVAAPPPPYQHKSFVVPYMFGSQYMGQGFFSPERIVEEAAVYAIAANAGRVQIQGSVGTVALDDGSSIQEPVSQAIARGEAVRDALIALGVDPRSNVMAEPRINAQATRSPADAGKRSVEIAIDP